LFLLDDSSKGGLNDTFVGLQIGKGERNRLPETKPKKDTRKSPKEKEKIWCQEKQSIYTKEKPI
jgi:hypothetical protein